MIPYRYYIDVGVVNKLGDEVKYVLRFTNRAKEGDDPQELYIAVKEDLLEFLNGIEDDTRD